MNTAAGMDCAGYEHCACVIVTYDPDQAISESQLRALAPQVSLIIIVDNGSGESTQQYLSRIEAEFMNVKTIRLGNNEGIARAQNIGIRDLIARGKQYVLLLDHDSIPAFDTILCLHATANALRNQGCKLGVLGARLVDPRTGRENGFYLLRNGIWKRARCGGDVTQIIECDYLNSSGSFFPIEALEEVGYFDELLFIDHVDTDWCMRAKSKGFGLFGVCPAELQHYMGESIVRFWWFGWRMMPRRTPKRHYFIVRNSLWLYRRPYAPLSWKLNNFAKLVFTLVYFSLFDSERLLQARMILSGVIDGLAGPARATKPPFASARD